MSSVDDVLHSKWICTGYLLYLLLDWYCWFVGISRGLSCVRKTSFKLFFLLMRRIQWNHVRRKRVLVSQMFLLREILLIYDVYFLLNGLFWQNNKSDLILHLYPLYWYQWGDQQTMHQRLPVDQKIKKKFRWLIAGTTFFFSLNEVVCWFWGMNWMYV